MKGFQLGTARSYSQRTRIYTNVLLIIPLRPGTVLARQRNVSEKHCPDLGHFKFEKYHAHGKQGYIVKVFQSKKKVQVLRIDSALQAKHQVVARACKENS